MNEVRYAPRASREEAELITYIKRQDFQVAILIAEAIAEAVKRLAADPRLGSATDTLGVRRYPIRKYGVTLYVRYKPRRKVLEVVRIVRGRRVKSLAKMP